MSVLGNTPNNAVVSLNFTRTRAPIATDDASQGYAKGSHWTDTGASKTYICISNAAGAAVWKEMGGGITPPPPPPSDITYPASYFNGPLGNANPVPSKLGAFLGTWGPSFEGGAITWSQLQTLLQQREADMGRTYDIIMTVDIGSSVQDENRLPWIHNHGSIVVCHLGAGLTHSGILAGSHNALLDSLIARWGGYSFPVMIRLFHEFGEPGTSYYALGNTAQFVQSWQYIVDRFRNAGADNCGFWWCPTEGTNRDQALLCYPGDNYVDWVGTDQYNWPRHNEPLYANPYVAGWVDFNLLFNYDPGFANLINFHDRYGPRKPFVIGETGCTFDNQPGYEATKGQWYSTVVGHAKNMEYLRGICFFDVDASSESANDPVYPKRNDWRVTRLESIPSIYQSFCTMGADPWLRTRE